MGQHARTEEDLALADPVQVRVQLKGLDLQQTASKFNVSHSMLSSPVYCLLILICSGVEGMRDYKNVAVCDNQPTCARDMLEQPHWAI